jgi:very-short-patch-repair endonuclease
MRHTLLFPAIGGRNALPSWESLSRRCGRWPQAGVGKARWKMNVLPFNHYLLQKAAENRRNMPPAEVRVWQRLRRKQIIQYDFDRQKPILNYIVDFYCKEAHLAVEIDGSTHNDDGVKERARQQEMEELGVWFLRFSNQEAYLHPDRVANAVLLALEDWEERNGVPEVVQMRRERLGI